MPEVWRTMNPKRGAAAKAETYMATKRPTRQSKGKLDGKHDGHTDQSWVIATLYRTLPQSPTPRDHTAPLQQGPMENADWTSWLLLPLIALIGACCGGLVITLLPRYQTLTDKSRSGNIGQSNFMNPTRMTVTQGRNQP